MSLFKSKLSITNKNTLDRDNLPPSESILDNITNGFFILDPNWHIKYTNKSMEYFVKKTREELIGNNIWEVLPEAIDTVFYHYYHKAMNEQIPVSFEGYYEPTREWLEIRAIPSDEGLIVYAFNITERKKHEQKIEYMAYHDYLTDIPNRRSFEKKLDQLFKQNKHSLALIYVDMDRLKYVNDTLGHTIGDQLIKQFSLRLIEKVSDKGFVARVGGDEFAIILERKLVDTEEIADIAKRLVEDTDQCVFKINNHKVHITTSLGICLYPENANDVESLIKNSDLALYRAKAKGGNTYHFYNPIKDITTYKRFMLEKDLHHAIEENKLELYYQPRVNTKTGRIVSAECLVRWNHSEWGVLSPSDFIPLAEETGLIHSLTKWVARTVCHQIKTWQKEGISLIPISINVSAQSFLLKDFILNVQKIIEEAQIDGKWIEIEITETSFLDNQSSVESTINKLKDLGLKVSLDDFGRGYSSLAYLTQFKVDILKIDKYFVQNVTTNHSNASVVRSVIQLAHGLGMKVVAEGVETIEELKFLKQQECDEIQGYIFSKPVPVSEFYKLLTKRNLIPNPVSQLIEFENRRKYFRVDLFFPLSSQMTIIKIKDKGITLGTTEVLLEDIGIGGLRFLSHLSLAVNKDIIFQFETEILGEIIQVQGFVVWKQEIDDDINQYGIEFTIDENERDSLARLLNRLALQIKNSPLVPKSRMVDTDKLIYLKKISIQ